MQRKTSYSPVLNLVPSFYGTTWAEPEILHRSHLIYFRVLSGLHFQEDCYSLHSLQLNTIAKLILTLTSPQKCLYISSYQQNSKSCKLASMIMHNM